MGLAYVMYVHDMPESVYVLLHTIYSICVVTAA